MTGFELRPLVLEVTTPPTEPQLLHVLYIIVGRHSMFRYVPTYIAHVDLGTDLPQWSQIYP